MTDKVLNLARKAGLETWRGNDGRAYCRVPTKEASMDYSVHDPALRHRIRRAAFKKFETSLTRHILDRVISQFESEGLFDGNEYPVGRRVGYNQNSIYIDLLNGKGEVVEITEKGYHLISRDNAPIRFLKNPGMLPLPTPTNGEKAAGALEEMVAVFGWDDQIASQVIGFIIGAVNPARIYPLLVVQGIQGSGKSILSEVVKMTLDPDDTAIRSLPSGERDLAISAAQTHLIAFDNLSGISKSMSDSLCRMSTGGAYRTRKLYTGRDEERFQLSNPVILNGIDQIATRNDLADRSIVIEMPDLSSGSRVSKGRLLTQWEQLRPRILGELCNAWSHALRKHKTISISPDLRMRDYAKWIGAAQDGIATERDLLSAYEQNVHEAARSAVEYDPVAASLFRISRLHEHWRGSAGDLQSALSDHSNLGNLGQVSVERFANRVRRAIPVLKRIGVCVYTDAKKDPHRRVTIYNVCRQELTENDYRRLTTSTKNGNNNE